MSDHISSVDVTDLPSSSAQSIASSSSRGSEATNLLCSQFPLPPTPTSAQSPSPGDSQLLRSISGKTTLILHPSVTVSFDKGSRLFKLRYTHIDVCKDPHGNLKCLELSESPGLQGAFIHKFPGTRRPVPHIEQPIVSSQKPSFVVSFLEEQTIQMAQTLFSAQPHYSFDNWEDCMRFQEMLLDQKLLLVAGIAQAKSKGRGEECISQNLRIFQATNGRQTITFFANSQRKEKKGYVLIPVDCIDHIYQEKKAGRPVSLRLRPNSELLAQLKALQVQFLEENDQKRFCEILYATIGAAVA